MNPFESLQAVTGCPLGKFAGVAKFKPCLCASEVVENA